jgi:LVIVD repeat-containing protein
VTTRFRISMAVAALCLVAAVRPAAADGPLSPAVTIDVPGIAHDVEVVGNRAYVSSSTGLTVLDITNPIAPVVLGSVAVGTCEGLKVSGDYAYMACLSKGLKIVKITNASAPVVVGTRLLPYAWDVALKGSTAYVASFGGELYVVNVANPASPQKIKTIGLAAWKTPGPDAQGLAKLNSTTLTAGNAKATGVTVTGNDLFTVDWAYGRLYYYDVSTATSPVFRGTHYAPYLLRAELDPTSDTVYMLSAYGPSSGIYTVPRSLLAPNVASAHATCAQCGYLASRFPTAGGLDQGGFALGTDGRYLVYGGGRSLGEFRVIDVSNPDERVMTEAGFTRIGPHQVATAHLMGVKIVGDHAFFAAGALGLQVYTFPGLSP